MPGEAPPAGEVTDDGRHGPAGEDRGHEDDEAGEEGEHADRTEPHRQHRHEGEEGGRGGRNPLAMVIVTSSAERVAPDAERE